jgi:hypothetical protein
MENQLYQIIYIMKQGTIQLSKYLIYISILSLNWFFFFDNRFHFKIITEQIFKFGTYLIPFICVIGLSFIALICFLARLKFKLKIYFIWFYLDC